MSVSTVAELSAWCDGNNTEYERLHLAFEQQFWGNKMALAGGDGAPFTTARLGETKEAMEAFLRCEDRLAEASALLEALPEGASEDQRKVVAIFKRTLECYQMKPEAAALRRESTAIEDELNAARNKMTLGYVDPKTQLFVEKSSVGLRNVLRTESCAATRKAAWEASRSIGPFVLERGFCEMVRKRNAMAKQMGYEDFYDYKVTNAEGFGKRRLFEILDTLRQGSDALLKAALEQLASSKGADALEAWNSSFAMAGDVEKLLDPYFPFEKSVEAWGRSFAKMGIVYRGATMTLDLLDRKGKYSNGFCHWPQPAWTRGDGSWQPTVTNFTSLADPTSCGSGKNALATLMHEAGHAAHFSNIVQPSPLFSQERAPTSVAYAENQSMFLDSLVGDAAWRAKYALDRAGGVLPWDIHEADVRAKHPYEVFALRGMLAVPYFEKALYELEEVTDAAVTALADKIEREIQGGLSARPLLSVPHILSDEASCYYHGYCLAEMSVHQTRAHFGGAAKIVDNKQVGAALTDVYWRPGNSVPFLELVKRLTGAELTGEAWIGALKENLEAKVAAEKRDYDSALAQPAQPDADAVDLDMTILIKDGDQLIADSGALGGFLPTCAKFEEYIKQRFAN